jgi:hypothetical protein
MCELRRQTLTVATINWDDLAPLACGDLDVDLDGLELRLNRFAPLTAAKDDARIDACEQSLGQYLLFRLAGNQRWAACPIHPHPKHSSVWRSRWSARFWLKEPVPRRARRFA